MRARRTSQLTESHSTRRPAHEHREADSEGDYADHASLLANRTFSGRGNASVQALAVQRIQQAYGNKAARRFLQRSAVTSSRVMPVQRMITIPWMGGQLSLAVAVISLIDEVVKLAEAKQTMLPVEDVKAALVARDQNAELLEAFNKAVVKVMGGKEPGAEGEQGEQQEEQQEAQVSEPQEEPNKSEEPPLRVEAKKLLRLLEKQFILDPKKSSLDLLPPEQRDKYRDFKWEKLDFPGNKEDGVEGPNQDRARRMLRDLGGIRPERRVGSTDDTIGIVTAKERTEKMMQYILDELEPIPGQKGKKLNRLAVESFSTMEADAARDGVALIVRDAYRSPEKSALKAAKVNNPVAVAALSPHNLGVAIDLKMSAGKQQYEEATTRPMQNVVDMRESPVHKWMFMRGAAYGWYPYQVEPWHFEYNPEGMRERFRANMKKEEAAKEE
jgi:hypothetical protein